MTILSNNRSLVIVYNTSNEPRIKGISTDITLTNWKFKTNNLTLTYNETGQINLTNLQSLKGDNGDYLVYKNGVFQKTDQATEYNIPEPGTWNFIRSERTVTLSESRCVYSSYLTNNVRTRKMDCIGNTTIDRSGDYELIFELTFARIPGYNVRQSDTFNTNFTSTGRRIERVSDRLKLRANTTITENGSLAFNYIYYWTTSVTGDNRVSSGTTSRRTTAEPIIEIPEEILKVFQNASITDEESIYGTELNQ
jgi:hypothetical protein